MGHHARLSPSNKAWPYCPGQIREAANYPDVSGAAAIDGTGSHILLEHCLLENKKPEEYKGLILGTGHEDKPSGWYIDTDRIKRIQYVISYIDRRKSELASEYIGCIVKVLAESKSNPGKYADRDDWYGTADITIIVQKATGETLYIEIVDLKDGRIFVVADDNSQLTGYLAGKVFEYGIKENTSRMTIIQPKTKPIIRYENISYSDLLTRFNKLRVAAFKTDDPKAPLIADDKQGKGYCKWCPHNENCEALKEKVFKKMTNVTDKTGNSNILGLLSDTFDKLDSITGETLSDLLDVEKPIADLFKRAKKETETRLKNGQKVGHFKIAPDKGSNIWSSPEEDIYKVLQARKMTKDEIYPASLISPAQVMKSDKLTDKQKETIQKKYIEYVAGKDSLKVMSKEEMNASASNGVLDLMTEASKELNELNEATEEVKQQTSFSFI